MEYISVLWYCTVCLLFVFWTLFLCIYLCYLYIYFTWSENSYCQGQRWKFTLVVANRCKIPCMLFNCYCFICNSVIANLVHLTFCLLYVLKCTTGCYLDYLLLFCFFAFSLFLLWISPTAWCSIRLPCRYMLSSHELSLAGLGCVNTSFSSLSFGQASVGDKLVAYVVIFFMYFCVFVYLQEGI